MAKSSEARRRQFEIQARWWDRALWTRWIAANALGELFGLGIASLVGMAFTAAVTSLIDPVAPLVFVAGMIFLGTFEGAIVGWAQSLVLRNPIPLLRQQTWIFATAVGAFAAWTLGMVPSTLIDFGEAGGATPEPDIDPFLYLGLAAGMGAVFGVIFALPQWHVLKRFVTRAGVWIPANAVAWACAMPIIFLAASSAPEDGFNVTTVFLIAGSVTAAGAVVGAIHGVALNWLVSRP